MAQRFSLLSVFLILAIIAILDVHAAIAFGGECPEPSKLLTCTPKCRSDSDCRGGKCCRNICNGMSCADSHQLVSPSSQDKYSMSSNRYTMVSNTNDCGGMKCTSFEKCVMDVHTKRYKCVRL